MAASESRSKPAAKSGLRLATEKSAAAAAAAMVEAAAIMIVAPAKAKPQLPLAP